jgi:hypothetical protein
MTDDNKSSCDPVEKKSVDGVGRLKAPVPKEMIQESFNGVQNLKPTKPAVQTPKPPAAQTEKPATQATDKSKRSDD